MAQYRRDLLSALQETQKGSSGLRDELANYRKQVDELQKKLAKAQAGAARARGAAEAKDDATAKLEQAVAEEKRRIEELESLLATTRRAAKEDLEQSEGVIRRLVGETREASERAVRAEESERRLLEDAARLEKRTEALEEEHDAAVKRLTRELEDEAARAELLESRAARKAALKSLPVPRPAKSLDRAKADEERARKFVEKLAALRSLDEGSADEIEARATGGLEAELRGASAELGRLTGMLGRLQQHEAEFGGWKPINKIPSGWPARPNSRRPPSAELSFASRVRRRGSSRGTA